MALKEMSKRHQRASNRKRWVGGLRLLDEPIINSNDIKNSELRIFTRKPLKRLHILNKIYKEHRRERRQTGIIKKNYYQLYKPSKSRLSPIGKLAKKMMDVVLKAKGKKEKDVIPWQHTVERIKSSTQKRNNIKKMLEGSEIKNMDQLVYNGLKRQGIVQEDLNDVIGNPEKLQQFLKKKRLDKEKAPLQRLVNLLRDGIKLGYAFTGQNSTELDNKTLKLVSPRFLSVTPEEGHNDTNLTSIPSLIKKIGGPVGFSSQDQQMWLDFIMEAAGVIEDAEKIEKELNNKNLNGVESIWNKHFDKEKYEREVRTNDGTPLYFTKQNIRHGFDVFAESEVKKVDLFEELQRKTNINQIREMNQTGYSLLTKEQLKMIYGPDSPYHDPKLLQRFLLLNNSALASHIEGDIHKLATIDSFKIQPKKPQQPRRKRAIILSPISFSPFVLTLINLNPVILSPIIFSPLILAPAILGPVILSPWVFVPLVLSPRLLTPLILSPPLFSPLILSPLALQPVILSPGAFAPLILSPVLLSPFILSPQVFTPLILSPLALNPFILNPSALSPVILSPFVLSPIILSPAFLSALILSPYALSPLIQSPLIAYSVILSPSYLS
uniref:Uncharacterized protein n=1 Tax=Meloidogyne enterolobii TaxID=390850 RepID=A0A6V7UIY0_MELEN|nr:unnamed protein product [Meloidogyne enterolobii]